jgi:hypothetical protein
MASRVKIYDSPTKWVKWSFCITLIEDASGKIGKLYGVQSIPHMYIIDKEGKIAAVHVGYGEGSVTDVIADINAALAKQSPSSD